MKELQIGGYCVKYDDEFEQIVTSLKWKVYKYNSKRSPDLFYAQCNIAGKSVYMHRLILDCSGKEIDHINRDGLDNRKENLRIATRSQNSANKPSYGGTSKFKGVCKAKTKSDRYRAWIMKDKKSVYLGSFLTEIEAAVAYNIAAKNAWGDFAMLNKVD